MLSKEFRITKNQEIVPAFRWKNGKILGIGNKGELSNNHEFKCVHFQKRALKFTPGLENEDSFLIVPNEFMQDHELTQSEIETFLTPDPEYARKIREKYGWNKKTLFECIKKFCQYSRYDKIVRIKKCWNKLIRRKLKV